MSPPDPLVVSERALLKRCNRKLMADGEHIAKARRTSDSDSQYHYIDVRRDALIAKFDDLERFARDLGALEPWESISRAG